MCSDCLKYECIMERHCSRIPYHAELFDCRRLSGSQWLTTRMKTSSTSRPSRTTSSSRQRSTAGVSGTSVVESSDFGFASLGLVLFALGLKLCAAVHLLFTCFTCCRVSEFAAQYSSKLGIRPDILHKTLWGDFYLEVKTKRIKKGAQVWTFVLQ